MASTAAAEVVNFEFTGTVTYATVPSPFGINAPAGTPVQGLLAWDPNLPPSYDTGSVAGYIQGPPSGMQATLAGTTIASEGNSSFQVTNDFYGSDGVSGYFSSVSVNSQPAVGSMSFYLSDNTATALSSTALPTTVNTADFSMRTGALYGADDRTVFFDIDTISPLARTVSIDIRPPNVVIPSEGMIPVLVATTDDSSPFGAFDATKIDPASVRFGTVGDEAAAVSYHTISKGMLFIFDQTDAGFTCTSTSGTLTGITVEGTAFTGTSAITIVGC